MTSYQDKLRAKGILLSEVDQEHSSSNSSEEYASEELSDSEINSDAGGSGYQLDTLQPPPPVPAASGFASKKKKGPYSTSACIHYIHQKGVSSLTM